MTLSRLGLWLLRFNWNIVKFDSFLAECAENVVTSSLGVRLKSFQAQCLPCNETNTMVLSDLRSETLRFSVETQNQSDDVAFAGCDGSNPLQAAIGYANL